MKNALSFSIQGCLAVSLIAMGLLTGCAVGPDYRKPDAETPAAYSEPSPESVKWKEAAPQDAIPKGKWWEIYGDGDLNNMEEAASANNQDLKVQLARLDQARALARVARSQFFPEVNLNGSGSEFRQSPNRPVSNGTRQTWSSSDVQAHVDLGYEVDIFGRVRRSVEAAKATVQVSMAEYETVRLTLHADVAQNYFSLRAADSALDILRRTIEIRSKALDLIRIRYKGGISTDLAVAQAETQLAQAQADLADVQKRRAELEHALAVLQGLPPEKFQLDEKPLAGLPPAIPVGLPSDLLERRPDIAQVERLMAAANARIGVAHAAFYPILRLSGSAGFESVDLGSVFDWPSRMWSVGPSLSLPLFNGGRNEANLSQAEAAYMGTVANYRGTVLNALREVEDCLSGLHHLYKQSEAEARAVESSQRAYDISNVRYRDGLVTYLDVVDTQRTSLETQRAAALNLGQRYILHVQLIKALGGGHDNVANEPLSLAPSTENQPAAPTPESTR